MRHVLIRSTTPPAPILVNNIEIPAASIAQEVQNHTGETPQQAWTDATRALVVRELLLQRARTLHLTAIPAVTAGLRETEEEALIRTLLEHEVRTPKADDSACHRYYTANIHRFRTPDLYEPQHILFKAPRDDTTTFAHAMERAQMVLAELTAFPDRFEAAARALSDCPSSMEGGRLGQVTAAGITPEFAAALRTTPPGTLCPAPVPTRYGVHVIRLERHEPGRTIPFEQMRDRIAAYLEDASWHRAVAQYIALLAGGAAISGFDMAAATSPLVQ